MGVTASHIHQVLAGAPFAPQLEHTPSAVRAAAQAHGFYVLRQLGWAQAVLALLVPKRPKKPKLQAHLLHALVLLEVARQWADDPSLAVRRPDIPLYAVHTVVDQAVAGAGRLGLAAFKRLINAVLRNYLRQHETLSQQLQSQPEAVWNYPRWWIEAVQRHYPAQWSTILSQTQLPAPLTLRVNIRQTTVAAYLTALEAAGIKAYGAGAQTVVLEQSVPVPQLPGYDEGWFSVQDGHAQLAAEYLPLSDGQYVLDACAAPGGKTAHLLEKHTLELLAIDVDAQRLQRVKEGLRRLRLHTGAVELLAADAAQPEQWWSGRPFDAILADVPCTASGVVRRHPDIRWLRQPQDVKRVVALQRQMVAALWPLLKPGGYLLYVTCSIFPAEGEEQIQHFLAQHADAIRLAAPGQLLPTPEQPGQRGGDGFFYALLQKEG